MKEDFDILCVFPLAEGRSCLFEPVVTKAMHNNF